MSPAAFKKSFPPTVLRLGGALALFLLLTLAATFPVLHAWDVSVTTWLQRAAPGPDVPANVLVVLGNAEFVIPGVVLAAAVALARERRWWVEGAWLAAGLIAVSVVAVALKHLIVHPGPPEAFQRHIFAGPLHAETPYSFPSGHTVRTTLLAGTLLRSARWLMAFAILAMMAALVYLGDHWMSDVLGGLTLGWAVVEARELLTRARSRSYPRG